MKRWTKPFKDNPIALQAHLLGKEYGMMPTETMNRPAWDFWMNARIRAAGVAWENEQKKKAQNSGNAGSATDAQKGQLVDSNEDRADRRERQDGSQPSISDQMAAFEGQGGS
jgi:hypothetical protein